MLKDIYRTLIESGNEKVSEEYKNIDTTDKRYIDFVVRILSEEYVGVKFKLKDWVMKFFTYGASDLENVEEYLKDLSNGFFVTNYLESEIEMGVNKPENLEILLRSAKYVKPGTVRLCGK